MKYYRRYKRAPLVYLRFLILGLIAPMLSIPSAQAQQVFSTQWSTIYYENPVSLREMERRLSFSQVQNFSQSYFCTQDPVQIALAPGLAAKIDGLLVKVCLILGRWPKNSQDFRIVLLKNAKEVQQRHLVFQPFQNAGPSLFGYGNLQGFYEPRTRTIFLSLADLRAGILAHELAHFVLCESFVVPPPASLQEDWARYVEARLD
jgi:hypothetical protein